MKNLTVQLILQSVPAIALALFGGFVAIFTKPKQTMTVRMFLGGLLAAAFVGLLLNLILLESGANETVRAVTVSLGGYGARDVLEILERRFQEKLIGGDDADPK